MEAELQKGIDALKQKLEALLSDENAAPADVLKASQELDVLITRFYEQDQDAAN